MIPKLGPFIPLPRLETQSRIKLMKERTRVFSVCAGVKRGTEAALIYHAGVRSAIVNVTGSAAQAFR